MPSFSIGLPSPLLEVDDGRGFLVWVAVLPGVTSVMLIGAIVLLMLLRREQAKARQLLLRSTGRPLALKVPAHLQFHLFLSHRSVAIKTSDT